MKEWLKINDLLTMVGLLVFTIIMNVIRLCWEKDDQIITKKHLKFVDVALALIIVLHFALLIWLIVEV